MLLYLYECDCKTAQSERIVTGDHYQTNKVEKMMNKLMWHFLFQEKLIVH